MSKDRNERHQEGNLLWGGRFEKGLDPLMEQFNNSISFDKRLWREDIEGSKAYAEALYRVKLLSEEERDSIQAGLDKVYSEWETDVFQIEPHDEDIHTANERRLKELIGEPGAKLHTGRSRNDQSTTDTKLWLLKHLSLLKISLCDVIKTLVDRAETEIDIIMPGYTHLQRAQPIRWSHYLLSFAAMLQRDTERLHEAHNRLNLCPLGSGALAGNHFAIDRDQLATVEFLSWASMLGLHLSKLAEDLIIYSTKEFSFITLSDAYSTGSSLMPQKKNADSLELIRGKAGTLFGKMCKLMVALKELSSSYNRYLQRNSVPCIRKMCGLMMTMKGLPSTYNKDLQEDKQAMFDVYDTVHALLGITRGVISTLQVNKEKCFAALSDDILATDLAYYLVRKGVPFRTAHCLAGRCVAVAEQKQTKLSKMHFEDFKNISHHFNEDVYAVFNYENSVEQYTAKGGTSRTSILLQISDIQKWLVKWTPTALRQT